MSRKGRLAVGFLAATGVVLVGGVATAMVLAQPPRGVPLPPPTSAPPTALLPTGISWSRASIVLSDARDPYNRAISEAIIEKNRAGGFQADGTTSTVYKAIQIAIGVVPIVGQAALIIYKFWEFVGAQIVPRSRGGWDELPAMTRQRGVIYLVVPRPEFLKLRRPYKSQNIDMTAPEVRPQRYSSATGSPLVNQNFELEYRAWLRRYLQEQAFKAEWFRITRTEDEPMLPKIVIELLYQAGAWPPPIEPMPLTTQAYQERFIGTENPARSYGYFEGPGYLNSQIIDVRLTPSEQQDDQRLADGVYAELWTQYQTDARSFADRIKGIELPPDLLELGLKNGSVPRFLDRQDPLGLLDIGTAAPRNRGSRL